MSPHDRPWVTSTSVSWATPRLGPWSLPFSGKGEGLFFFFFLVEGRVQAKMDQRLPLQEALLDGYQFQSPKAFAAWDTAGAEPR